jgi:XTP/dITP diphosphohydrolase
LTLLYASSNEGKLKEVALLSRRYSISIESVAAELSHSISVPEVGVTYEENARAKALAHAMATGFPCLADDSGIEIHNLGGLPGVYTSRFGMHRVAKLLQTSSPARFVCCMAYAEPDGRCVTVTETLSGIFSAALCLQSSVSALPYSRCFIPNGQLSPLSELVSQNPEMSHRAKALRSLLTCLGVCLRASESV